MSSITANAGGFAAEAGGITLDLGEGVGVITLGSEILIGAAVAVAVIGISLGIGWGIGAFTYQSGSGGGSSSGGAFSAITAAAAATAALVATHVNPPVTKGGTRTPVTPLPHPTTPSVPTTTVGGTQTPVPAPILPNPGTSVSLPNILASSVTPSLPTSLTISNKQIGKKGYHITECGCANHDEYRNLAQSIFANPDEILYDDPGVEYGPEFFYLSGQLLLRVTVGGGFISLYPGADSPKVNNARNNGGHVWP